MTDRSSGRDLALDAALATGLALDGVRYAGNGVRSAAERPEAVRHIESLLQFTPGVAVAMLFAVLAAAPLALRRRYPLLTLVVIGVATLPLLDTNRDLVFAGCILLGLALYSAAAYSPHRRATAACLPVAAALLVLLFQNAALPDLPRAGVGLLVLAPIAVAATGIRVRRRRAEHERAEAAGAAVAAERARLARELHDVVTHHVGMMVIQPGAARMVLDSAHGDAREALLSVEATGRTALSELRDVLGALGADPAARLRPQPGLDTVPELVGRLRGAGIAVGYRVVGEPRPVPDGIGLTAYRVAQEALTNAVKHAPGEGAELLVEYGADRLAIEVTDAGPGADGGGAGYGLAGLRDRVALHGGTFEAGPQPGGGFRVRARLPLAAA